MTSAEMNRVFEFLLRTSPDRKFAIRFPKGPQRDRNPSAEIQEYREKRGEDERLLMQNFP
jgi:hypothetical protein